MIRGVSVCNIKFSVFDKDQVKDPDIAASPVCVPGAVEGRPCNDEVRVRGE